MKALVPEKLVDRLNSFVASDAHGLTILGSHAALLTDEIIHKLSLNSEFVVQKLEPDEKKSITIEQVRALKKSFSLKQIVSQPRLIVVPHAELMGQDAQNSVLKLLEEPPAHVSFVLIAQSKESLLSTILSRTLLCRVPQATIEETVAHYKKQGVDMSEIQKSFVIASGDAGKIHGLLSGESTYYESIEQAKQLISQSRFERIAAVDAIAKDKQASIQLLLSLEDVLRALSSSKSTTQDRIVKFTQQRKDIQSALNSLSLNVNTKLVMLDVLLGL